MEQDPAGGTRLRQRATSHPRDLLGHPYWWAFAPFQGPAWLTADRGQDAP